MNYNNLIKFTNAGLVGHELKQAMIVADALKAKETPVTKLMSQLRQIKKADGTYLYSDTSDEDVRFIAADFIYTQNRHSLEWVDQGSKGVMKAAQLDGEILGFLEVVVTSDAWDTDDQKFTPSAIDMGQHTAAYKAYRHGHKIIDSNHNKQGKPSIIPVESWPVDEKVTGADGQETVAHLWKQTLYLCDPADRKLAADGKLTGISVDGNALGYEV